MYLGKRISQTLTVIRRSETKLNIKSPKLNIKSPEDDKAANNKAKRCLVDQRHHGTDGHAIINGQLVLPINHNVAW